MPPQTSAARHLLRAAATSTAPRRPISTTTTSPQAWKFDSNKDSLNPEPSEVTKSSTDSEAAQDVRTAFGRDSLSPEEAYHQAEKESKGLGQEVNPLEVSPANQEVSRWSNRAGDPTKNGLEKLAEKVASRVGKTKELKKGEGKRYVEDWESQQTKGVRGYH